MAGILGIGGQIPNKELNRSNRDLNISDSETITEGNGEEHPDIVPIHGSATE